MSKKETPRIFLYRISSQISLQKYTWVSFFKICQVLFVCAHQKKPVCWQTTRSRELLPHGFTDCFPYKPACAYHKFFTYAKRCFHIISYAPWFVNQCFNKNTLPYAAHAFLISQAIQESLLLWSLQNPFLRPRAPARQVSFSAPGYRWSSPRSFPLPQVCIPSRHASVRYGAHGLSPGSARQHSTTDRSGWRCPRR